MDPLAVRVLRSPVYTAQKKIAGRISVTDDQVAALLSALLRGAVLHAQRLLNVEGYAVLRVDADGATLILDEALLREQYGFGT